MSTLKHRLYQWGLGLFLGGYHLALLVLIPFFVIKFGAPSFALVLCAFLLFVLSGICITGGYHRYYAHRSFKAKPIVEWFLLFWGTVAMQGSALRWSFEHRLHHAYVDGDKDPYSINRGFWYAHFLWLFDKPIEINPKLVRDLMNNKKVMFQHKYYPILTLLTNALMVIGVGLLTHSMLGAFIFAGLLRIGLLHHFTWFINSLAHTWGSKTFSREHSAVDNYVISLVTFGEGYHNYHHTFCSDYRNGIRWFHFDPTKWFIWIMSKLGFARNLKTVEQFTMKKKQILYDREYLLKKLKSIIHTNKQALENKVCSMSDGLLETLNRMTDVSALYDRMRNNLKEAAPKASLAKMNQELVSLKDNFEADWKHWLKLSKQVLSPTQSAAA